MKISVDQLARQLEAQLGGAPVVVEPNTMAAHTVDGQLPQLLCEPTAAEQVVRILQICGAAHAAVIPWGGGTAMALGNQPRHCDVIVRLGRLDRVLEHDHANLTVTTQTGISLSALQQALAARDQFVPLDAPFPGQSTVGGIVAANLNGALRMSYGSVRDLVIGMKIILANGELIRAGGKVVKNVAGYDMCKLFTGSLGTLGIITEVTLRVAPIAASSATVVATGALTQAQRLAGVLANSQLLPTAVFLRNQIGALDWQVQIRFDGFAAVIARQVSETIGLALSHGMIARSLESGEQLSVWQEIRDFPLGNNRLIYRVTVPRAAIPEVTQVLQGWHTEGENPALSVDFGMGTVWISLAAVQQNVQRFTELIALAQCQRGHAVIFAASGDLKSAVDVWGPPGSTLALMRQLKQQFDPQGLLNPGRFIGGI